MKLNILPHTLLVLLTAWSSQATNAQCQDALQTSQSTPRDTAENVSIGQVAPKAADVVVAKEFQLVDQNGKTRGRWMTKGDASMLGFFDEEQKLRSLVGILPEGLSTVMLYDVKGQPRASIGVADDGVAAITVMHADGSPAGTWGVQPDGRIYWEQHAKNGVMRQQLSVSPTGSAGLAMFDSHARLASVYQVADNDSPGLVLYSGKQQEMRFSVTYDTQNENTMLNLHRADGSSAVRLSETKGAGVVSLDDLSGTPKGIFGTTPTGDPGILIFDRRGNPDVRLPANFDLPQGPGSMGGVNPARENQEGVPNQNPGGRRGGRGGR